MPWLDDMNAVSGAIAQQGPQQAQMAQAPPMPPPIPPLRQRMEQLYQRYQATGDPRVRQQITDVFERASEEERAAMRTWENRSMPPRR